MANRSISSMIVLGIIVTSYIIFDLSCKKEDNTSIIPNIEYGTITDIEGNQYKTVKIGDQWWMAENLKTTRYNDNTSIPLVTDNASWGNLNTPGYCWYGNDESKYKDTYGALYNWYTANKSNLCPIGWHVPSDDEWSTLTDFLGGGIIAGGKLKEAGTIYWNTPNTGATNEAGFSALPGSVRNILGAFGTIKGSYTNLYYYGFWWTSTEFSTEFAYLRDMVCFSASIYTYIDDKKYGFSVRCLKD